jgi:hypothetical protein
MAARGWAEVRGSVGTGERRRRRSAKAGGGEIGQSPEEGQEEKAAALAAGEASRWRNSGSHCSMAASPREASGFPRYNSSPEMNKAQKHVDVAGTARYLSTVAFGFSILIQYTSVLLVVIGLVKNKLDSNN